MPSTHKQKKTGLVLSGGGWTGICAQSDALLALEDKGCVFDTLIGTSAGSVVGAMYAAGYTAEEISKKVLSIRYQDYFDPSLTRLVRALLSKLRGWTGILKGDAFLSWLQKALEGKTFDNCDHRFSVVVTNVSRSWPQVKPDDDTRTRTLAEWVRASAAIPLGFQLAEIDGEYYADGGAVANIAARQLAERYPKIDQILVVTTLSEKEMPPPDNSFMSESFTPVREVERILEAAVREQTAGNLALGEGKELIYLHVKSTRVNMVDPVGLEQRMETCFKTAYDDAQQQLDKPTGPLGKLYCLNRQPGGAGTK
jgi:predicted acylesterase/phospholipase RssA